MGADTSAGCREGDSAAPGGSKQQLFWAAAVAQPGSRQHLAGVGSAFGKSCSGIEGYVSRGQRQNSAPLRLSFAVRFGTRYASRGSLKQAGVMVPLGFKGFFQMQRKIPPADTCFPCTFAGLQLCCSFSSVHGTTTSVTYFCAGHHLYSNGLVFNLNSCKRAGKHCNVNRVAANTAPRLRTKPMSPLASYQGCHSSCTRGTSSTHAARTCARTQVPLQALCYHYVHKLNRNGSGRSSTRAVIQHTGTPQKDSAQYFFQQITNI